jgi:uncharacterized protein YecT (DUF1311 family)
VHRFLPTILLLASLGVSAAEPNCRDPRSTREVNVCSAQEAERLEAEMNRYYDAARSRMQKEEPQAVESLLEAQKSWETYAERHCQAVYSRWAGGTIRVAQGLNCRVDLIKQRMRLLWESYLTYPDRTPPILPEPKWE